MKIMALASLLSIPGCAIAEPREGYTFVTDHVPHQMAAVEIFVNVIREVPGFEDTPYTQPEIIWVTGGDCYDDDGTFHERKIYMRQLGKCKNGITHEEGTIFIVMPDDPQPVTVHPFAHELGHFFQIEMHADDCVGDVDHSNGPVWHAAGVAQFKLTNIRWDLREQKE